MRNQGESSVEEILDSIKKVIARDNREVADQARRRRLQDETSAVDDGDGEDLSSEPPPEHHAPDPVDAEEADEVLELSDAELVDESQFDEPPHDEEHGDDRLAGEEGDAPLTNAAMRESVRENLAALSMLAQPGAKPQIVRSGETSLEGLARDMLRPMLAQWLDANLPDMVERLVKAEISRIAGKRR